MDYGFYLLIGLLVLILIIICIYINRRINLKLREKTVEKIKKELYYNTNVDKPSNINEWSYQRFCNFFSKVQLKDPDFDKKIESIYDLIVNRKETNLDKIAELSGCTFNELVLKISYLKNKIKIDKYLYIDKGEHVIRYCSDDDKKLLDKYSQFIYNSHLQPNEIAARLPGATAKDMDKLEKQVLDDLSYLDEKYLINCLNIDKVDKKIIYYTVEKHKKENDYISMNCDKCGALNDVPRNGKERCSYCGNIIEDKKEN